MEKIIILYDPQSIVFSFKEKITPIMHDKRLLKARVQISLETAINGIAKVEEKLTGEIPRSSNQIHVLSKRRRGIFRSSSIAS